MFSIILDQSVKTKDNVPVVIDTIVYQIDPSGQISVKYRL